MKANEFVGSVLVACGIAIMVGSTWAVLEYREREELSRQLEQWQQQEWIDNLIEMRRQEMLNHIKYKQS